MPAPKCELDHASPWQLLIATILSAQSTDKGVNRVTPDLFSRYPTPGALARAPQEEVEVVVKSTGFFRNKAKAIREASRLLHEEFGGEVPKTIAEMIRLPGVARKTANVVLGTGYGIPSGIPVDTHVIRLSGLLGLSDEKDPVKIERDLCALFPEEEWIATGHRLVLHGRYLCTARNPDCPRCPLNEICPSAQRPPEGSVDARARREGELVEAKGELPEEG